MAIRLHLGEQYATEYDRINTVFVNLYGVAMPRHKHYSPLTVKPAQAAGGQTLDPITGAVMSGSGLTPGSLRNRSQSAIAGTQRMLGGWRGVLPACAGAEFGQCVGDGHELLGLGERSGLEGTWRGLLGKRERRAGNSRGARSTAIWLGESG